MVLIMHGMYTVSSGWTIQMDSQVPKEIPKSWNSSDGTESIVSRVTAVPTVVAGTVVKESPVRAELPSAMVVAVKPKRGRPKRVQSETEGSVVPFSVTTAQTSDLGTLYVSEGGECVDVGVGVKGDRKCDTDRFRIAIPNNQRDEFFVPATCVRSSSEAIQEIVSSYANMLNVESTQLPIWEGELTRVLEELRQEFSVQGFQARLMSDAAGFVPPVDMRTRDHVAYVAAGSSLQSLVEARQCERSGDRFNVERCTAVFQGDPEYDTLLTMARTGVYIDTPPDLVLQSVPERPRRWQNDMPDVFNQHVAKAWTKGDVVVLPIDELSATDVDRLHYNPAHLTGKPAALMTVVEEELSSESEPVRNVDSLLPRVITEFGGSRFLMDCSNSESGNVLNTPEAKELVLARYSRLSHCTFRQIVQGFCKYADSEGVPLAECRLFKDDIQGAFTQMNINPESVYLLAMAIGFGLMMVYIVGLFGWLGFPLAFGVWSRAFERLFVRHLSIPVYVYVDDIIALSRKERADADQRYIENKLEEAIGSKAVNYSKRLAPTLNGEVLGWMINLVPETFRPGDKAIRKLMFAFWCVASGTKLRLVVYQMLGSLADHYSLGVPGMQPFTYALHAMAAKFGGNEYYVKEPSSAARMSIEVWKVAALLLLQRNPLLCRPMRALDIIGSLETERQRPMLYTDASPTGIGIGLYVDGQLLKYMSYVFPFGETVSQNAREYLGYMLGYLFTVWVLGKTLGSHEVIWYNDNKAALAWAEVNKCNSPAAQYALMVVTWLQMSTKVQVTGVEHVKGILMGDIDGLSRGYTHSMDVRKEYILEPAQHQLLDKLFMLLDLSVVRDLDDHHVAFSRAVSMTRQLSGDSCFIGVN